jgi:hypothetical protein
MTAINGDVSSKRIFKNMSSSHKSQFAAVLDWLQVCQASKAPLLRLWVNSGSTGIVSTYLQGERVTSYFIFAESTDQRKTSPTSSI